MQFNKSSGQASRTVIILAVIILIIAGIAYGITRFAISRKASSTAANNGPPQPVYDLSIGDIRFVFESAQDLGNVLYGSTSRFPNYQPNLVTTEKFIKVIVRAQNTGNNDTQQYAWDLGNIIDSAGRNFLPLTDKAYSWIPQPDLCDSVLHPEFEPTPCVRYYEVSKVSDGLKLQVTALKPNSSRSQVDLLDLNVTK